MVKYFFMTILIENRFKIGVKYLQMYFTSEKISSEKYLNSDKAN